MEVVVPDSAEFLELYDSSSHCKETVVENYLQKISSQRSETVPDFPTGLKWMNTLSPLSIYSDLKGKLVILDFFTYCCINCMHVLPVLKSLEDEFPVAEGLVVIGVHSAKFTNEKESANIESAVNRYNVCHPVVNDCNGIIWDSFNVRCWPTLFVIGPRSEPLLVLQGEGHGELLRIFIKSSLNLMKKLNLLSLKPFPQLKRTMQLTGYGPLLFPGKIAGFSVENEDCPLIAISDTGHNRILVANINGNILHIIGGSSNGLKDGNFEEALFSGPQGLTFAGQHKLFVADTSNHCIREINLKEKYVKTIAGDGIQGHDRKGGKLWTLQRISSPWDVCFSEDPDILYIAMAGNHQIWALFLNDTKIWKSKTHYNKGVCIAVAGSGREENRNNCYPMSAAFSQPSGLAYCSYPPASTSIIIADSESSAIRRMYLNDGKVSAMVGGSPDPTNLFAFGDQDGIGFRVKLQHPLAVACYNDKIYVADSYNHKIKVVTPDCRCATMDLKTKFSEPAGLCVVKDRLFIADTNNHRIVSFDLNLNSEIVDFCLVEESCSTIEQNFDKTTVIRLDHSSTILTSVRFSVENRAENIDNMTSTWNLETNEPKLKVTDENRVDTSTNQSMVYKIQNCGCEKDSRPEIIVKCHLRFCTGDRCIMKSLSFLITIHFDDNVISTENKCHLITYHITSDSLHRGRIGSKV